MANTTNFNWETPDDTDLVKDGAAAIRTLGSAIDTSLVDLKGGTTGQILAKNSNTDMDFIWASDASGIPATIFDAKGDIIAASAADTAARLAVGANNTVLTADSSTATGLKWSSPPGGKVLQVVQGTKLDTASTTSQTFVASGVSISITPSSATSKILIISQISLGTNPSASQPYLSLYRGGSAIFQGDTAGSRPRVTSAMALTNGNFLLTLPITYLDSPATTSATTYEVYYRGSEGGSVYINRSDGDNDASTYSPRGASSIIALEIGA